MRVRLRKSDADLWTEFLVAGNCGLCGNTGKLPRIVSRSPSNSDVVLEAGRFCICPNGRRLKEESW